jgi:hypothetical protein
MVSLECHVEAVAWTPMTIYLPVLALLAFASPLA